MAANQSDKAMPDVDFFDDNSSDDGESMVLGAPSSKTRNFSQTSQPAQPSAPPNESQRTVYGESSEQSSRKIAPPRPPRSPEPVVSRESGIFPSHEHPVHLPLKSGAGEQQRDEAELSGSPLTVGLIRQRLAQEGHIEAADPTGSQEALVPGQIRMREDVGNSKATTLGQMLISEREEQLAAAAAQRGSIAAASSHRASVVSPADFARPRAAPTGSGLFTRNPVPLNIRKSFLRQSRVSAVSEPNEALLVLTLQRRRNSTRPPRFTDIRIPANLDIAPAAPGSTAPIDISQKRSEKHFDMVDFDDAHFFRKLRAAHARLAGWPRYWFSARKLHRIDIISTDPANSPRSPLAVAASGLADSFSEANFMRHYQSPRIGKAQYIWVHWAHRFASIPTHLLPAAPMPSAAMAAAAGEPGATSTITAVSMDDFSNPSPTHMSHWLSRMTGVPAGSNQDSNFTRLEFVHGWAIGRLIFAVFLVGILSIVGALVWIFEGASPGTGDIGVRGYGFKDAGQRVADGCLIGVLGVIIGWTLVALWALVSWLCD